MYEIIILNNVGGRDVFQYEDRKRFDDEFSNAESQISSDIGFRLTDDFSRTIYYRREQAIAVMAWDLKQAIRGNVKEQITILAAQGAAQMEASPPGAVTSPPNRHTRRKTGKGK